MLFMRLPGRRLVPWIVVFEVLRASKAHWDELDPRDRTRLVELLRKSKGQPKNLSERERTELRKIARHLELIRFGRNAATAAFMGHRRARRGH
jgi:hypothetical protein